MTKPTEFLAMGKKSATEILKTLTKHKALILQQTHPSAMAYLLWYFFTKERKHYLLVVPNEREMERFHEMLSFFSGLETKQKLGDPLHDRLLTFPPKFLHSGLWSDKAQYSAQRIKVLTRSIWNEDPFLLIAPVQSLLEKTTPRDVLFSSTIHVRTGDNLPDNLGELLNSWGYTEVALVEEPGDWSRRGDVIDCYIPLYSMPVRFETWGTEVESIRFFHPATQRSIAKVEEIFLVPAGEIVYTQETKERAKVRLLEDAKEELVDPAQIPQWLRHISDGTCSDEDKLIGVFYEEPETLMDYMPSDTTVIWWDADTTAETLQDYFQSMREKESTLRNDKTRWFQPLERWVITPRKLREKTVRYHQIWCDVLSGGHDIGPSESKDIPTFVMGAFGLDGLKSELFLNMNKGRLLEPLAERIRSWREDGIRVIMVCTTQSRAQRIADLLEDYGLPVRLTDTAFGNNPLYSTEMVVTHGSLSSGFCWPAEYLAILSEEELFGKKHRKRSFLPVKSEAISSFQDLKEGDYVVHVDHGIGIYRGLVHLTSGSYEGDFLLIEYMDEDRLYVPVHNLHKVQKYIGVKEEPPRIDRLGGRHWERVRSKAKEAAEKVAKELLQIYALRQLKQGYAFSPPDKLYYEFEAAFPFDETPDQMKAIEEVLQDMMSPRPMDRLVCGDVGYGKTEVALRAAFKAVMDGKQVAVLVPTTVLAEQHYRTFSERFGPFPIKVELLSRFKSRKEQTEVLQGLKNGDVDIVIGTHRLLQKDVTFRDLGLLIIDEEHRFGVRHKERLKALKVSVDVLTLSATPIPRTLHMALSGIKDLSVIETPPEDRKAVKTFVMDFDTNAIRDAIRREINRGGQVFFVHNHVQSIHSMADLIRSLVPEASIAVAHGQMKERELEKVMLAFVRGQIDVLVCTTIIESGLDIPRANTIIINRADRFGLAQMYQLRGRVGRSDVQAYAYLIVPGEHLISKDARKRLRALLNFSELGSGFRIAMNDLQIRGGGTILGSAQSGHIAAVGYELYLELVQEMIQRLRGDTYEGEFDPEIKLDIPAFLPDQYIPDTTQRLVAYKKLSSARNEEEIAGILKEWRDRYGNLPSEAKNLVALAQIRLLMRKNRILKIEEDKSWLRLSFASSAEEINFHEWVINNSNIQCNFHPEGGVVLNIDRKETLHELVTLRRLLQAYSMRDNSQANSLAGGTG
ncbi:MAG: transcription-repair coupling factor [Deltaproteobacteria bacterium]|nr:transcription-repair coupling factor [Deltaproteobacteria bacterium]MBW2069469.1 transcription-repair coupling factor [Deltaproteobacteria bacterium]